MKRVKAGLACAAIVVAGCHEKPAVLAPDIKVEFGCATNPSPATVAAFLSRHGFAWSDEEQARRRQGKTFFPLQIDAVDRHRVIIEVIGLRKPRSYGSGIDYRLTITSPPPTRHDDRLESSAVGFVRETLRCEVHDVGRYENDADSSALFDSVLTDLNRRMRTGRGS